MVVQSSWCDERINPKEESPSISDSSLRHLQADATGEAPAVRDGQRARGDRGPAFRAAIAELVREAAAGDQKAWDALVDQFASTVWAIARAHRLNAADAADVSQTTWLRLLEHLHRIEQPERVGAWLATTARRESLHVLRMAGRQVPNGYDFDVLPDSTAAVAPDRGIFRSESARLVTELIGKLPVRSQLLLRLLSADSPLSYRDISEALSMPIGSIGPTRARALEQLRRLALGAGYSLEDVFA
jgi:RNA polymerase sigma factor (sigma-70 family)